MPQPDQAADVTGQPHAAPGRDLIEAFADEIRLLAERKQRGDLASLRRLDPETPDAAAFFRIVVKLAPEAGPDSMRRYARLVQNLALNPDALKQGRLGTALAAAGVSEGRVLKLLAARGPALARQLHLIARRLANAGALPYRQLADLVLEPDDSPRAEDIRLRIARDYWHALDRGAADATPQS
jgi:CRISPR system Cascade subunit CasB